MKNVHTKAESEEIARKTQDTRGLVSINIIIR